MLGASTRRHLGYNTHPRLQHAAVLLAHIAPTPDVQRQGANNAIAFHQVTSNWQANTTRQTNTKLKQHHHQQPCSCPSAAADQGHLLAGPSQPQHMTASQHGTVVSQPACAATRLGIKLQQQLSTPMQQVKCCCWYMYTGWLPAGMANNAAPSCRATLQYIVYSDRAPGPTSAHRYLCRAGRATHT